MFARTSRIAVTIIALFSVYTSAQDVSETCIGCLCEVMSACNTNIGCTGSVCGPFGITQDYWTDGGKPTLNNETLSDDAFSRCVNDPYCAAATVRNYMTKYGHDCNGDDVINCEDYLRIHKLGFNGCTGTMVSKYEILLDLCLQKFQSQDQNKYHILSHSRFKQIKIHLSFPTLPVPSYPHRSYSHWSRYRHNKKAIKKHRSSHHQLINMKESLVDRVPSTLMDVASRAYSKMFRRTLWITVTIIVLFCVYTQITKCAHTQFVSQECLGCICLVTSGCNNTLRCEGPVCGAFRITKSYWVDAGKPLDDRDHDDEDIAFRSCANKLNCATVAVKNYMSKFRRDCNGDGVINCDDYVRLHRYGVDGCTNSLHYVYESIYTSCINYTRRQEL
ncbi:uncharacterized protein LOC105201192 [Solenopsis invicta]|uniref:uncharacterized protein LOC105201192 n=1 Tax=Solenopsis invicta TaxID=13686 RepID=UPI00193DB360|nr:uncharacterized protein LOC105201192 [Solenopsis invicta]